MVALQSLNLSVGVRVPVPQPKTKDHPCGGLLFFLLQGLEPRKGAKPQASDKATVRWTVAPFVQTSDSECDRLRYALHHKRMTLFFFLLQGLEPRKVALPSARSAGYSEVCEFRAPQTDILYDKIPLQKDSLRLFRGLHHGKSTSLNEGGLGFLLRHLPRCIFSPPVLQYHQTLSP